MNDAHSSFVKRDFLSGGGEAAELIRAFDWSATAPGPIEGWPQSLKTATALLLNSPVPMVMLWGPEGFMIYNDSYSRFAGGRHPELLGSKVRAGWPEVADFNDNVMRVGLAGGTLAYKDQELTLHRHGRPEQVWMNLDYSPVLDESGLPGGVLAIVIETTERVAAEAALRESEARFRNMADHAPVMMWVTDQDGLCTYLNRQWHEFTGQTEQAAQGFGWLEAIHPDDKAEAERIFLEANGGGAAFRLEYRLRRADGEYRWSIDAAGPRFDAAGGFLGYVGSVIDIDERRDMEDRLRDLNDTLERRVAATVAEREQVEEALRQAQKMEAVGQLTGGIAHDFNNLLTIIAGNVDMARRGLATGDTVRVNRAIANAQKGAERAAALTQRLLAFSRRQPLAPRPLDVDALMASMADLLHRALGETVELETAAGPGLWLVEADPNQLESAILNLAVNARDAMSNGGRMTIETANVRIGEADAAARADVAAGAYVAIAITDTGEGMARDVLTRVFDPFFTTKEVGKGTGLGLSMVYGFVKQSGGHVTIDSEPGAGTTVTIYLPRFAGGAARDEQAPVAAAAPAPRGQTVLVVEDDDDVRAYTVEILRELGYRVIEAHDGASALRLLDRRDQPVDLLFTDVVMPVMSGRELADQARARHPGLKILYTSGYTRDAIVQDGRLTPDVAMIAKPFTYQALARKIGEVLEAAAPALPAG